MPLAYDRSRGDSVIHSAIAQLPTNQSALSGISHISQLRVEICYISNKIQLPHAYQLEADASGERVEIQATNWKGSKKLENPIGQNLKA